VKSHVVLARKGGNDIGKEAEYNDYKLPLESFKLACGDLLDMHKNGIYMRDIKPQNMVYKDGIAKHIDLETVCTPHHSIQPKEEICGTPCMLTKGLLEDRISGDKIRINASLKAGDQFAMLQTMMFATGGKSLAGHVYKHD